LKPPSSLLIPIVGWSQQGTEAGHVWATVGSFGSPKLLNTRDLTVHGDGSKPVVTIFHWIALRENLQETMVFTIKYRAFL